MEDSSVIAAQFRAIHDTISEFLVALDGQRYQEDLWTYEKGRGGGVTRVWQDATVFEKGGVNFSAIEGDSLPTSASTQFQIPHDTAYAATGVSLVMHPRNPHVPTIHMNVRYFEAGERWWFGGGMDLTPCYPVECDIIAFHQSLKRVCEKHGEDYAARKTACDEYFYLSHRKEARGVGGIFFDHLSTDRDSNLAFTKELGMAFPSIYGPIVRSNCGKTYTTEQREFQSVRRGRYAEFNLVYDRGTRFGLQSGGRIESVLMSMPPAAAWKYDWRAETGSPEAQLTDYFLIPRDWAASTD